MSKKDYKENISVSIVTNAPQLTLQNVLKDIKVSIWGYELCNGAEWQDFLEVVNKLGKENEQLKSRISELEDQDWYESCIRQLEEQNDRLIQEREEKDKAIENLKQEINEWVGHKFVKLQYQKAIQELEKIEELLLDEYKKYPIVYDKTDDLVCGALDRDKTIEIINQQIKELKGE